MLLAEVLRILHAKHLIEVLAGISQLICARYHERVVWDIDNTLQSWHLGGIYLSSHYIAHEEQLGVTVVHDVVYLVWHKLVQDRHSDGTVCESSEESHCPVGAVSAAKCYLVALYYARIFKHDV